MITRIHAALGTFWNLLGLFLGGSGEIRTHERLTPSAVFKSMGFSFEINQLSTNRFRNMVQL